MERIEEPSPPVFGEQFGQEWNRNTKFVLYIVYVKDLTHLKLLHSNNQSMGTRRKAGPFCLTTSLLLKAPKIP